MQTRLPLKTLLESHRRVLKNVQALSEGQVALVRATELAGRMGGGEARRMHEYLDQMEMLCMQQKLLAMQLVDAIQCDKAAAPAGV